jgi:hypothetical protein
MERKIIMLAASNFITIRIYRDSCEITILIHRLKVVQLTDIQKETGATNYKDLILLLSHKQQETVQKKQ